MNCDPPRSKLSYRYREGVSFLGFLRLWCGGVLMYLGYVSAVSQRGAMFANGVSHSRLGQIELA